MKRISEEIFDLNEKEWNTIDFENTEIFKKEFPLSDSIRRMLESNPSTVHDSPSVSNTEQPSVSNSEANSDDTSKGVASSDNDDGSSLSATLATPAASDTATTEIILENIARDNPFYTENQYPIDIVRDQKVLTDSENFFGNFQNLEKID